MRQEVVAPPPTARPPQAKPATGPRKPSRDPFEFSASVRTEAVAASMIDKTS